MAGTNPVGAFAETNYTTATPPNWLSQADANFAVAARSADSFAPRPNSPAGMSVVLDAGFVVTTLPTGQQVITEAASQTLTIGTAPSSPNNRVDLIVVDAGTGTASVVAGTPATSAATPALPAGKMQVATVSVPNGTTSIINSSITDIRGVWGPSVPGLPWAVGGGTGDAITAAYTPANAALTDGLMLAVRAPGVNTSTAPTFAPDGLTAATITKAGGSALAAGDIAASLAELLLRYNLAHSRWELLNPPAAGTTVTSGAIISALGYTPQNAATGPTSTQITTALGYTPAASTSIGGLAGKTVIAGAVTLGTGDLGKLISCGGSGGYIVTLPSPSTTGAALTFWCPAGPTVTLQAPSGSILTLTTSGSSYTLSGGYGGAARLIADGTNWLVVGSQLISGGGGGGDGGGGGG